MRGCIKSRGAKNVVIIALTFFTRPALGFIHWALLELTAERGGPEPAGTPIQTC